MGTSTVAVGLIPSFDDIGVLAPVLLVAARFLQALASAASRARHRVRTVALLREAKDADFTDGLRPAA
jgi:hypothetical protein